jgi:hypothetical protein
MFKNQGEINDIFDMRKEITLLMSKKIDSIVSNKYRRVENESSFGEHKDLSKIWFHYTKKGETSKQFSFVFRFSIPEKYVSVKFYYKSKWFEIEKGKELEDLFVSLCREVKKFILSDMYNN